MTDINSTNVLKLQAIPDLCNKNYFIPDYQRGYRWGEKQIRQLLEDLTEFFEDDQSDKQKGKFYCLQPIVVKEMTRQEIEEKKLESPLDNNKWYEVIDGQQRLTTIRIILALKYQIFGNLLSFNIFYKTRKELKQIFDDNSGLLHLKKNEQGKYYLESAEKKRDIDTWHIINTAEFILDWFQSKEHSIEEFIGPFFVNFARKMEEKGKSVRVIWYELKEGSPIDLFKRLNDKKISLNNAELVRAMFLSDSAEYPYEEISNQFDDDAVKNAVEKGEKQRKISHIVEMWDVIESQLRNDKFWAFIDKNNNPKRYSCRIEFIFDLLSRKKEDEGDELYTYLELEKMCVNEFNGNLWKLWMRIESYYSILKSWFENVYYYHKIGYLVALGGNEMLLDLLKESVRLTKTQFKASIHTRIVNTILVEDQEGKPVDIFSYSYEKDNERKLLMRVLLLYNVETTLQQNTDFFPFDRYKKEKDWSIEHIHAQNSEGFDRSDSNAWNIWIKENNEVLKNLNKKFTTDSELQELIQDLDKFSENDFTFEQFEKKVKKVNDYYDKLYGDNAKIKMMHNLPNLALLSSSDNASFNNSVFEVKRQKMIKKDAEGKYIPICTRKVFLKYYNAKESDFTVQQLFLWDKRDRDNYEADIRIVLKEYIGQMEITNLEESEVTYE